MHTTSPQNPVSGPATPPRSKPPPGTGQASVPVGSLPGNGECAGSSAADRPRGAAGGAHTVGSDLPTAATTDQKARACTDWPG